MSGSSLEALPDVREVLGGPPGCLGVVGRPFRMYDKGQEALGDLREWSEGPPGCPGVVGMHSRMFESGP